jgi:hypothetical protein
LTLLTACHFGGPRDKAHAAAAASRDREKRDGYDYSDSKVFWGMDAVVSNVWTDDGKRSWFFAFFFPSFLPSFRRKENE